MRTATLAIVLLFLVSAPAAADDVAAPKPVDRQVADLIASMEKSDYAGKEATDKLVAIGKPAVAQLLVAIKHPAARVRYWSAAAVARIGDESAYAPLVELAKSDASGMVRATALWYLQHYPRQEVWDLAIKFLDDPSREMRGWAIKLLSTKNRTEALAKLEEAATKHADYQTRYDAMVAVTAMRDADAIEFLRGIVKNDVHETVRKGALSCLTVLKTKPPVLLTVLIDGLEDKDAGVREFAGKLLRKGTTQEFPFEPSGDSESRAAGVRAWREWFDKHKDRLAWDAARKRFEIRPQPEVPADLPAELRQ